MEKYNYYFKIADILIQIKIPFEIIIKDESIDFMCDKCKEDIFIEFIEINKPIKLDGELVFNDTINIYNTNQGFIHEFYPALGYNPYGWLIQIDEHYYKLHYLKGMETYFKYSKNIINAICIENILNKNKGIILHCSFVRWKDKAILFSAPSGTGKSTQADLWNKYENAEIINGDRAGIRKIGQEWMTYGLPYAGSSNIFKNKKSPISHLIILRQGKENKLKCLSPREAFIKIYSETTIHTWDEEYQNNTVEQILDLVQKVPVYLYECLPNGDAVKFLKQRIEMDNNGGDIK